VSYNNIQHCYRPDKVAPILGFSRKTVYLLGVFDGFIFWHRMTFEPRGGFPQTKALCHVTQMQILYVEDVLHGAGVSGIRSNERLVSCKKEIMG